MILKNNQVCIWLITAVHFVYVCMCMGMCMCYVCMFIRVYDCVCMCVCKCAFESSAHALYILFFPTSMILNEMMFRFSQEICIFQGFKLITLYYLQFSFASVLLNFVR